MEIGCDDGGEKGNEKRVGGGKHHPSFSNVGVIVCVYIGLGSLCFYPVRAQLKGKKTNGVVDSVYFCVVTMSTVGYGDLVPSTVLSKLLSSAFIFSGMAIAALLVRSAAEYLVDKQQRLLMGTHNVDTKHKTLVAVAILCVLASVGTVFLAVVEEMSLVDALYCVCSTITTLGYGDRSFSTAGGRVFAVFWILSSTVCLGHIFFYIAELGTEERQKELVKWVVKARMIHDGEVGAAHPRLCQSQPDHL